MDQRIATKLLTDSLAVVGQADGAGSAWWPRGQPQRTVLSHAIALAWLDQDRPGPSANTHEWISTCWSRHRRLHEEVYRHHGVDWPQRLRKPRGATRHMDARQYLVDFSVWAAEPETATPVFLTMESEMYSQHGVGDSVTPGDGYSYDFFKLVWLPSPRRLFTCCVGSDKGRKSLKESLTSNAKSASGWIPAGNQFLVYIFPRTRQAETHIGVWDHAKSQFSWSIYS